MPFDHSIQIPPPPEPEAGSDFGTTTAPPESIPYPYVDVSIRTVCCNDVGVYGGPTIEGKFAVFDMGADESPSVEGIAAAGALGAAAAAAGAFGGRRDPDAPEQQRSVLQVSSDHLTVGSATPANLAVEVWAAFNPRAVAPAPGATIQIEAPVDTAFRVRAWPLGRVTRFPTEIEARGQGLGQGLVPIRLAPTALQVTLVEPTTPVPADGTPVPVVLRVTRVRDGAPFVGRVALSVSPANNRAVSTRDPVLVDVAPTAGAAPPLAPGRRPRVPAGSVGAVPSRFDVTRAELAELLADEPRYRVEQVWRGLYEQLAAPSEMTSLPKGLRSWLDEQLPMALTLVAERTADGGDTVKLLWQLEGGARIETVLMMYPDRATVCVSSQAGCAMACGFCATGQAGFTRHLTSGEIVEQVVRAARIARDRGRRVSNVVYMGMGEPMANEQAVWSSVERLHSDVGLSARHLTISTVGLVPGIRRLAARPLPVNLAVSLHAANDQLRDELVPINRRYPLDALMSVCADYLRAKGRRLSFEWALIDGVNDRPSDAVELAGQCRALPLAAHVNLIPLNPTPGYPSRGTPLARVHAFRDRLTSLGVNATVRQNRGTDIDAACGQLAATHPVAAPQRSRSDS